MPVKDRRYANELREVFEGPARKKGFEEGFARGMRSATIEHILMVLGSRSIAACRHDVAEIEECTEQATLDVWFVRSLSAASVEEVFGG
ncbi:hypothetical protein [Actinomadura gamaensis]|uniref:Transposase n=1 Tax=Actinomadura gamaensis TaxID=1763541 RepID=A0ABV9U585_9ACTN